MTQLERDEEQRDELIKLVANQIRSGNTVDLEILLGNIDNSHLEDFLEYDTIKAFWKKYPVS
jgi:hypothetical protein